VVACVLLTACATVPQNRREYLADPTMQIVDDPLEAKANRKLHITREGAAGGDAEAAGGGCGCGN
jgi:hypothetical protein